MQLFVDSTGRAGRRTIRDLVPARQQVAPVGAQRPLYDMFVAATREAILRSRYEPARIGGCRVRQLVQQSYTFAIAP